MEEKHSPTIPFQHITENKFRDIDVILLGLDRRTTFTLFVHFLHDHNITTMSKLDLRYSSHALKGIVTIFDKLKKYYKYDSINNTVALPIELKNEYDYYYPLIRPTNKTVKDEHNNEFVLYVVTTKKVTYNTYFNDAQKLRIVGNNEK